MVELTLNFSCTLIAAKRVSASHLMKCGLYSFTEKIEKRARFCTHERRHRTAKYQNDSRLKWKNSTLLIDVDCNEWPGLCFYSKIKNII